MLRGAYDDTAVADFQEFVRGSQARLIKFAVCLTGDVGHAEDLVQNAYARAFASWPKLRTGRPEAYVRRCIVNGRTDWWRRGTWKEEPLDPSIEESDLADAPAQAAERDAVLRALDELTRRERAVVVLRYYYDLATEEIAEEMGVTATTVRTTLFRALAKLRASEHVAKGGTRA